MSESTQKHNSTSVQMQLVRSLAQNLDDMCLLLFNRNLIIKMVEGNKEIIRKMGLFELEGKEISITNNTETLNDLIPYFELANQGKKGQVDFQVDKKYFKLFTFPLYGTSGKIKFGAAMIQNVTQIKTRSDIQEKSKDNAERANLAKTEFLARVSHEIRTPLNAILGFAEQLLETNLDQKQLDYVKIIDKSGEHLLALINDILVISKIEAQQITFEKSPFKIEHTVRFVHKTLVSKAQEKNIRFTYGVDEKLDTVLLGDSFRLRQILMNMASNAIKFTSSGYVEIKCFMKSETDNDVEVRFDIVDTGIGIKKENLEIIFNQFKQADSRTTLQYGGTGLGLTICKNLIEMQNGSLAVSSQPGVGSTFSFVLTYLKGKEEDLVSHDEGEINSKKLKDKKVLLVDDDSINRLLGKTMLEKLNCDIDIANSGYEAIERINQTKFDIILLDIHMPDINGLEVAKYLRQELKDSSTKIIAVTAAAMKEDIQDYYKSGIDDFLLKPFKEIYLFNKMCELLNIHNKSKIKPKAEIIIKEESQPKPYNLSELKNMMGNNQSFINQMLQTFIENTESSVYLLQQHLKDENWEQIGETAHKILPSYKHLEIKNISEALLEIKTKTIIKKDYQQVPELVNKTITWMKKLVIDLKEEISN